ncbi:hypothetical protein GCM10010254_05200 [Streptomyces chromofuscus]|nr:hypothetical protein GCM10010254_05200 [Streptomyces chromofuscus]
MPGPGQHDADRGEDRGPRDPEPCSGAHRARVGGRHGGLIIALGSSPSYGRSARFRTVHEFRSVRKNAYGPQLPYESGTSTSVPAGPARLPPPVTRPEDSGPTYTVRHRERIPRMGGITLNPRLHTPTRGNR